MTFCSMLMLLYTNAQFRFFSSNACVDIILWAALVIYFFYASFSYVCFPGQKREYLESRVCFQWREKREYKRERTKDVRGNI